MQTPPRTRPGYAQQVDITADEVMVRARRWLATPDAPCVGNIARRHLDLHVRDSERHFWSPHLSIVVREASAGARLQGRFGPHPEVWTLFVALYATTAFIGLIGAVFGAAQLTLGYSPWALLIPLVALLVGGGLYGGAVAGQRLGADQMEQMRDAVDGMLASDHDAEPERVILQPSSQGSGGWASTKDTTASGSSSSARKRS